MRRIGTLSTSIGLIFYGIILLLMQTNKELGMNLLKFWPVIFIILGIEILLHAQFHREDGKRAGFNGFIILVIILFICTNAFYGVKGKFIDNDFHFFDMMRFNNSINNSRQVNVTKAFEIKGNKLIVNLDSGDVILKKSSDKMAKFDGKVYINPHSNIKEYNLNIANENESTKVDFNDNDVNLVKGTLFIPEGCSVDLEGDDLNIENNDNLSNTNLYIKSDSLKANISKLNSVKCENDSGLMEIEDTKAVTINSDSAKIDLQGEVENIDVNADSSMITVKNRICKNVNIQNSSGAVSLKTQDNNLKINAKTDSGVINLNGEKKIDGSMNQVLGNGTGMVNINTDSGVININTR